VANQFTALGAELSHWKVHVPDKKMQKKQRKHYSVDGPHYAAVEGQPQQ
jgi:hypothetical protein